MVTFMFPVLKAQIRSAYLPVHVYFGVTGFVLATAAALLGLTEKAFFVLQ